MSRLSVSLSDLVRRAGPPDYQRAARYALDVAHELAVLHLNGELHRTLVLKIFFSMNEVPQDYCLLKA